MKKLRDCVKHGETLHTLKTDGKWRCNCCGVEATNRTRIRNKTTLVEEAGGQCARCGYNKCSRALTFHHRDATEKLFDISGKARTYSLSRLRAEAQKCDLLCMNCHMELEHMTPAF